MVTQPALEVSSLDDTVVASRYRLLFELGRGGTARVFLALLEGFGGFNKLVVLKFLKESFARDADFQASLINEARLHARLTHANIVQVLDVLEHRGAPVIALEYLPGKSLYEVVQRAPRLLDLRGHLMILIRVLAALHHAHELKAFDGTPLRVVHRDLTPQNVFLTYDGEVKLLDFGIAKVAGALVETEVGTIKGKVRYMAPEQLEGRPVDRRADIFACGVLLWEAIAGRRLWADLTDAAVIAAVLDGAVPTLRDVGVQVEDELEQICLKALSHDPQDRYSTAEELQLAIEAFAARGVPLTSRELARKLVEAFSWDRDDVLGAIERRLSRPDVLARSSRPVVKGSFPSPSGRPGLRSSAPPKPVRATTSRVGAQPVSVDEDAGFQVTKTANRHDSSMVWLVLFFAVAIGGYLLLWQPAS